MTKISDASTPSRKKRITIVAIWTAVILFVFNLFTGVVAYGLMTIWCLRLPVTASKFAASYTYFKPGQAYYGPNAFAQYYCNEEAARRAGFNPSPLK